MGIPSDAMLICWNWKSDQRTKSALKTSLMKKSGICSSSKIACCPTSSSCEYDNASRLVKEIEKILENNPSGTTEKEEEQWWKEHSKNIISDQQENRFNQLTRYMLWDDFNYFHSESMWKNIAKFEKFLRERKKPGNFIRDLKLKGRIRSTKPLVWAVIEGQPVINGNPGTTKGLNSSQVALKLGNDTFLEEDIVRISYDPEKLSEWWSKSPGTIRPPCTLDANIAAFCPVDKSQQFGITRNLENDSPCFAEVVHPPFSVDKIDWDSVEIVKKEEHDREETNYRMNRWNRFCRDKHVRELE
jgi:hypothetical protein